MNKLERSAHLPEPGRAALASQDSSPAVDREVRALARPWSPAALVLTGHVALTAALFISDGFDQLPALVLVFVALGAWGKALLALAAPPDRAAASGASASGVEGLDRWMWGVAFASGASAFIRPPADHLTGSLAPYHGLSLLVLALLATYALDVFGLAPVSRRLAMARRALLLLAAAALGAWMIHAAPNPPIDVYPLNQQIADTVLQGKSIYATGAAHTPETFLHKNILEYYVYPPLPAYLSAVAYYFTHEVRWADLAGMLIGAALLWVAAWRCFTPGTARGRAAIWADLVAAALLFHPRAWMILDLNWIESLALPFFGAFVVAHLWRRPLVACVCLGLFCAVKQHLVLYLPWLAMAEGVGIYGIGIALITMAATMAPSFLSSPYDFYRGNWLVHKLGPFRGDSLSLTGQVSSRFLMPSWVGFVSAVVPLAWARQLRPRFAPLLVGVCMTFGLFYLLGRQAFLNYYYLLDATALFALATMGQGRRESGEAA